MPQIYKQSVLVKLVNGNTIEIHYEDTNEAPDLMQHIEKYFKTNDLNAFLR